MIVLLNLAIRMKTKWQNVLKRSSISSISSIKKIFSKEDISVDILKSTKISLSFLILICLAAFLGCSGNNGEEKPIKGNFEEWGLDGKTEMQIKQDYLDAFIKPDFVEATIEDVWIEKFYGIYGARAVDVAINKHDSGIAKVAVIMGSSYDELDNTKWSFKIEDVLFKFEDKNEILIWREEEFYTLQEAFDQKMLEMFEIFQISGYHNGLCMDVANEIKEYMFEDLLYHVELGRNPWGDSNIAIVEAFIKDGPNFFEIYGYYGTYNGYAIVTVWGSAADATMLPFTIADILFLAVPDLPHSGLVQAWKDGQLDDLDRIYYTKGTSPREPSGLLTEDDIRSIYNYHRYYYFSRRYEWRERQYGGSK